MIIECPQCQAKYQYSEDRFDGKPSKKIRCAKCQTVFEVKNPAAAESGKKAAGGAKKPSKRSRPEPGDSTVARKVPEPPAPTEEEETHAASPLSSPTGKADPSPKLSGDKRYSLAILDGPDAGKVFRIEETKVVIGRSGADLTLDDIEASRHHAAVEIRDPVVLLYDLESTNGTLVDGEKITQPVELFSHGEFTVGTTTLMLIVTDEA